MTTLLVKDWPGYSISDDGQIFNSKGKRLTPQKDTRPGKGHLRLVLWRDGEHQTFKIHILVLETFVGPRPDGYEARHLDGNPENNRVSNLAWGTSSENSLDQVRHGRHAYAKRTHCTFGHEFTPENTIRRVEIKSNGSPVKRRRCITCKRWGNARDCIDQIRVECIEGIWPIADLAYIYSVSPKLIAELVFGPAWQYLDRDFLISEGLEAHER
jgi:hypothetical protein